MIYSIDGKIASIDGNVFERRVNQLTYQVKGSHFPELTSNNGVKSAAFYFVSSTPNTVIINYGDGNIAVKEFEYQSLYNGYKVQYTHLDSEIDYDSTIQPHSFSDPEFEGIRNITFEFENPMSITRLNVFFYRFHGNLPTETSYFENLKTIRYNSLGSIGSIPDSFPKSLASLDLGSTLSSRIMKIQDQLLGSSLATLLTSRAYDLSDEIASNFYKISQLKNTLARLDFSGCKIKNLPTSLFECDKITDLRLIENEFDEVPNITSHFPLLKTYYIGSNNTNLTDKSIPYMEAPNLEFLLLWFLDVDVQLSDISSSFTGLHKLTIITQIKRSVHTVAKFDEFTNAMYDLSVNNGSIVNDSNAYGGINPQRFRNISWGDAELKFTGAKVAPTGYVQGVSNGTPSTAGQRAYVLQNQYNHTITHGTPL